MKTLLNVNIIQVVSLVSANLNIQRKQKIKKCEIEISLKKKKKTLMKMSQKLLKMRIALKILIALKNMILKKKNSNVTCVVKSFKTKMNYQNIKWWEDVNSHVNPVE